MQAEFDVGLFSLHPNHTTHNFPGKLLGYSSNNWEQLLNDIRSTLHNDADKKEKSESGQKYEINSYYNIAERLNFDHYEN